MRGLIGDVVAAHADLPDPTGLRAEEFTVIERREGEYCLAHVPLAFCPESALIVHGPIILGRVAAVAEGLLRPGEQVMAMARVRVRKPVRRNLKIVVAREAAEAVFPDGPHPAIEGRLIIGGEASLRFAGWELPEEPVTRWIDNAIVDAGFSVEWLPGGKGQLKLSWRPSSSTAFGMRAVSFPEALQVMLEMMVRAIVLTRGIDGRGLLLSRIGPMAWPSSLIDLIDSDFDIIATLSPTTERRKGRDWRRVPVHYQGVGKASGIEGRALVAEGRVTLGSIFA
ncbi:MAG: hypothetical protein HN420_13175 [Rhodospirillaceae bacterium]|nr:hypothetical protein [Rhodospirillaceae bacterium]